MLAVSYCGPQGKKFLIKIASALPHLAMTNYKKYHCERSKTIFI